MTQKQPKGLLTDIEYMRNQAHYNPGAVVLFLRRQGIECNTHSLIKLELALKQLVRQRKETV